MRNFVKLFGMVVLTISIILAFSFTACGGDDGDNNGNGTGAAPTITTASLPGGTVGTAYSQTLTASGDTPITWSKESGDLPNGLTLSAAGVISGNPTTANTFTFTVKATNAAGSKTKSLSITISSGGDGGGNAGTYIITGSNDSFTATKNGATVGTANQTITNVITAIRTDANGVNCTIQFGSGGTNVLNIGTAYVDFNNTGGTWGVITLSGNITSSGIDEFGGSETIYIGNAVSVISTAEIGSTYTSSSNVGRVISKYGTGTVTISSGKITATGERCIAISHYGDSEIIIDGGTVSSSSYTAISLGARVSGNTSGSIIINNGTVSNQSRETIRIGNGNTVTINGGTVSAIGSSDAMVNSGTVNVKGGSVLAVNGSAISNNANSTLTISNGTVKKTGTMNTGNAISNSGTVTVSGGTIESTGTGYYSAIMNYSGSTITITAGIVRATGNNNTAISNGFSSNPGGTITITGGTISATGTNSYAVYNYGGTVTITSPPTVIDKAKTSGTITWLP
jgi:hypothetical protein